MRSGPNVFLGLGSNQGDRAASLEAGLRLLGERGFRVRARSRLYQTEPVGGPPQAWFLNAVARGETDLTPEALLAVCLAVERELGRERGARFGPRTLDLDLLLFGEERRAGEELTLPHPRLHERRFVLVPLAELSPGLRHPALDTTIAELLLRCPDRSRVVPAEAAPAGPR